MQHELEKFVTIATLKSYSKAAKVLHISQPSLSVAIQNLEKQLKVSLFTSNKRPLELTEAGKIVLETALRIKSDIHSLHDRLKQLGSISTSLRLGAIDSAAKDIVASYIVDQVLSIWVDNSSRLVQAVIDSQLDAAIITTPVSRINETLEIIPFANESFSLVCAPQNTDAVKQQLRSGTLIEFITYNTESTTYKHIVHFANNNGYKLNASFISTSPELMRSMLFITSGAALLPTSLVRDNIKTQRLIELASPLNQFKRPLSGVFRTKAPRKVAIRSVLESLRLDFSD